jgi:rRNA maturation protein Nop10
MRRSALPVVADRTKTAALKEQNKIPARFGSEQRWIAYRAVARKAA